MEEYIAESKPDVKEATGGGAISKALAWVKTNYVIAIAAVILIVILYFYFFSPKQSFMKSKFKGEKSSKDSTEELDELIDEIEKAQS